jgi:hypothetical protein
MVKIKIKIKIRISGKLGNYFSRVCQQPDQKRISAASAYFSPRALGALSDQICVG